MELSIDEELSQTGITLEAPAAEEKPEVKIEDIEARLSAKFQTEISATRAQVDSMSKDRAELIAQNARMAGFIEAKGVGRYDATTGTIIEAPRQEVDEVQTLEAEIKQVEQELKSQKANGDLTDDEYYQLLEEKRGPLKDRLSEVKYDRKLRTEVQKIEKTVNEKVQNIQKTNAQPSVVDQYNKIAADFPEVNSTDSKLFQEMSRLFVKYPAKYAKANFNQSGDCDPKAYRELAEQAAELLEAKGEKVAKARTNAFSSPANEGYSAPGSNAPKSNLNRAEINMLIAGGYSNPSLIKEINSQMGSWGDSVTVVMKEM